jgi:riboflavin synthase
MERTRFGSFRTGTEVNLERALTPKQRMGGHFVQGHVDGLAEILDIRKLAGSWRVAIKLPDDGKPFVVEKGSVALDGVSLTVASRKPDSFEVEIIPHTWEATTLHSWTVGGEIHLEYDILAKYVSHMLGAYTGGSGLTMDKLMQSGFGGM